MLKVYKYLLNINSNKDEVTVTLPSGAKMLDIALQGNKLFLWALVDPDLKCSMNFFEHTIKMIYTGEDILPDDSGTYPKHLKTLHFDNGIVAHFFEV